MAKREPLRIRLSRTHTIAQIEVMIKEIENDPDSKVNPRKNGIYSKSACDKMDEMSWAIHHISRRQRKEAGIPESIMQTGDIQLKNW